MKGDKDLTARDIGNTYVGSEDRYVVSFIVGYQDGELVAGEYGATPQGAAAAALSLTTDENAGDTHWYVFDRQTGVMHQLEQREFDPTFESDDWSDDDNE